MDYEEKKELRELMRGIADDLLELKAVLDTLITINEDDTTTTVILGIAHDLAGKVFNGSNNCKKTLELSNGY